MARRGKNGSRKASRNTPMPVFNVDAETGPDEIRLDRYIQSIQNSQGQVRVLCNSAVTLTSSNLGSSISFAQLYGSDDFASMAQQFELYRVKAIRFDVYSTQTSNSAKALFGTFHADAATSAGFPAVNLALVTDSPDAKVPGTEGPSTRWTWMARGSHENDFYSTESSDQYDFGGIRFAALGGTFNSEPYYNVVVKYVVDFRGRK